MTEIRAVYRVGSERARAVYDELLKNEGDQEYVQYSPEFLEGYYSGVQEIVDKLPGRNPYPRGDVQHDAFDSGYKIAKKLAARLIKD